MNKMTLFCIVAMLAIFGAFWIHTQSEMARERCIMAGGRWSDDAGSCDGG